MPGARIRFSRRGHDSVNVRQLAVGVTVTVCQELWCLHASDATIQHLVSSRSSRSHRKKTSVVTQAISLLTTPPPAAIFYSPWLVLGPDRLSSIATHASSQRPHPHPHGQIKAMPHPRAPRLGVAGDSRPCVRKGGPNPIAVTQPTSRFIARCAHADRFCSRGLSADPSGHFTFLATKRCPTLSPDGTQIGTAGIARATIVPVVLKLRRDGPAHSEDVQRLRHQERRPHPIACGGTRICSSVLVYCALSWKWGLPPDA
ncbi:hypothetical protein A0H81_05230 [Grifola frondosa]|uniref:Uncharacterized protein n=1 Tax=Grifola frondosa TaxID=5627 RepID=A0A1C7MDF1_GRIFR|nr:hypothetical protein A0H81_05230 [Grifola frondosa]